MSETENEYGLWFEKVRGKLTDNELWLHRQIRHFRENPNEQLISTLINTNAALRQYLDEPTESSKTVLKSVQECNDLFLDWVADYDY